MSRPPYYPLTPAAIPCITLWRPWADWVVMGLKTIETRRHCMFRGLVGYRLGIHAGLRWDEAAFVWARPYLTPEAYQATLEAKLKPLSGQLLGTVLVTEARWLRPEDAPAAMIECGSLRYGLRLADPFRFVKPIFARGRQGIWKYQS